MERLNVLNNTNDGFRIADEDLKLRGPGDLFGIRQSGEFGFAVGDIYNDADILRQAAQIADNLLKEENEKKLNGILGCIKDTQINSVDFRTI